jgi:hypothetical protein
VDTFNFSYAGIGSRRTPPDIIERMQMFAAQAARYGWTLRSGAAQGADSAFELGCDDVGGKKEIFLPWRNFNRHPSNLHQPSSAACKKAMIIHPAWKRLSMPAQMLVSRNMHQVFGEHMIDPVKFVMCWTPDGCESHETYGRQTGGTGTAISAASRAGIPIFNIANPDRFIDAIEFILNIESEKRVK